MHKIFWVLVLTSLILIKNNSVNGLGSFLVSLNDQKNYLVDFVYNATTTSFKKIASKFNYVTISRDNVTFTLYRPYDPPITLSKNFIDRVGWRTKIIYIIHGWYGDGKMDWIIDMVYSYFEQDDDYYIVVVDWSRVACQQYFKAIFSTQSVGNITAQFLWKQIGKRPSRLKNVHVIGHSLGAHVAGFVGKKIYELAGRKIGRITGLEAASIFFDNNRLYKDDADFIDCYHTDIGVAGQLSRCGQVDVYFNCGGPVQPECGRNKTSIENFQKGSSCSHSIVHDFFINTILNPKAYPMKRCITKSNANKTEIVEAKSSGLRKIWKLLNFWRDTNLYAGQGIKKNLQGLFCVSTTLNADNKEEKCLLIYNELIKRR